MLRAGDQLGKYQLEHLLGRGGMGEVWAARDPDLDRRVAVKVLRGALTHNAEGLARLQREGRAMARLRHPNVITVYDATFADGRGLIVMELIDGENLASWLGRAHPQSEIIATLLAAGRGLAAAHGAGMLHRDFKPHNVLVERGGRVLVTDFGLARAIGPAALAEAAEVVPAPALAADPLSATIAAAAPATDAPDGFSATVATALDDTAIASTVASKAGPRDLAVSGSLDSALTQTGSLLGTPAYMAPEQLLARSADERCDQFAFCVTAWEVLTGARPFGGTDAGSLLAAIEAHRVVNEPRVPRRLRAILHRGLASEPGARWPSMAELLRAFERAWRRPRQIALAGGALAALGAVAAALVILRRPAEPTCADEGAAISALWSPAVASQLRAAMVATGAPHAGRMHEGVAAAYARYAAAWSAMRTAACTAHRGGDATAAPTLACLEVRRAALAKNLASVMAGPKAGFLMAIPSTTRSLEPIATCARPTDPQGKFDDAARVRAAIKEIRARYDKGETQEARRALDRLGAEVAALGYPPLRATVLVAAARLADLDNDVAGAESMLRQAIAMAERGGEARIKIDASIRLASALVEGRQYDEAKRMLDAAEASLAAFGVDFELEADLARGRGYLALGQDALDEAARHYERSLDLDRAVGGTSAGPELVSLYTRLGRTTDAEALRSRLEAERRANAPAGAPSPVDEAARAADHAFEQCERAEREGALDEAIARCGETVALEEARLGPDASHVAMRRLVLGRVLAARGDHAKARAQYVAAAASAETNKAKDALMYSLALAGKESLALGEAPAAIDQYRRCSEVSRALGKPGEDILLVARAGLGRALALAQQDREAIAELEWALPRLESQPVPRGLGTARLALAEALWRRDGRNDRARARLLAAAAREFVVAQRTALKDPAKAQRAEARDLDELIARIDRWVSKHR